MSTTALDPKLAPYGEVTVRTVSDDTLVSALVADADPLTHAGREFPTWRWTVARTGATGLSLSPEAAAEFVQAGAR